ncbi:hypothetical protein BGHDH14_bgh04963 [Blumeria hordei DH14]|uniref:Uncharacterized protein n=1 Tax=Blumeria graminis f. sp. hordei (strain DH14) TaxID=546991 RepID=N1JJQ5_BLUG1|nr:hypothetical protein BGHDH14_bgh04963 [Blumeria hordei DH14]
MQDKRTELLLAQVPLTVSPFVNLPVATTLPYTYKKLPSTLPLSSADIALGSEQKQYAVSASGHAVNPTEVLESCKALKTYVQKVKDDADSELKSWEDGMAARDLAEKRRVAPGWLDSEARILHPERPNQEIMDMGQISKASDQHCGPMSEPPSQEANELDRAFGGLEIHK